MAKGNITPDTTEKTGVLDGQGLIKLIEAGFSWLKTNQQIVNSLNVFPVPDGDTGTNMVLTLQAAYNEITKSNENNIGQVARNMAQGALMGARGNSGVILSQIFRGFARILDNIQSMDGTLLVRALVEARDTAYKGVVRPVEGTILTVITEVALSAQDTLEQTSDLKTILECIVDAADRAVKRTPDLLPILKQAGVVDSGGKGLFFLFEGMLRYINDLPLTTPVGNVQPVSLMHMEETMQSIEPGQDFEVVIDFTPFQALNLEQFYNELSQMGTSIQLGEGDGNYRMHIHVPTDNRYSPIDFTMGLGTISKVYIENLIAQQKDFDKSQHPQPIELTKIEPGHIAVVTVSPGEGISRIFASLGAASIINGGQSMNPSTEEIMASFEQLPTDKIIILPNNANIFLAAQNAKNLSKKQVAVIPSKSIPQGLSAILRLIPDGDFNYIVESMTEALGDVDTGEITTATRSVEMNGVKVHEGEVVVLYNGKLINSTNNLEDACMRLFTASNVEEKERITLFRGNNVSQSEVDQIIEKIKKTYPSHEIELHEGGQPHYQFIIAIE